MVSRKRPTAVHTLREVHVTPPRPLAVAPGGVGTRLIDHRLPFQSSTFPAPPLAPTAMQNVRDGQDTLLRRAHAAPGAEGCVEGGPG